MKKLLFFVVCVLALSACDEKKQQTADLRVQQERDSLNRIIAQKDNEINDMMSTFNDIEEGFRAISAAEQRVSVARQGEGASMKERIQENMQFIQQTMQQNRELINKLRSQLRQSSVKGDQLRRTLENLTQQLEEKDAQIKSMIAELKAKDVQIEELNTQVSDLKDDVGNLEEESTQKSKTISAQDKELNTAWFVFGTKKELKEQRIIADGEVLRSDFNQDYFTRIDIRVDKEIKLYSRSAKLLTSHPASSYRLEQDANKQYILRIENPSQFWSTSKYLVIQVK
jgi:DNA repair exonuclease SbcCD ATPase subunit